MKCLMFKNIKKVILGALLVIVSSSYANTFNVSVKGISAGKATLLTKIDGDKYIVTLSMRPNMAAKLIGAENIKEVAKGKVTEKGLVPLTYSRFNAKGKQILSAKYESDKINIKRQGKPDNSISISSKVEDPLSQILQIKKDLMSGNTKKQYYLLTDKKVQKYNFLKVSDYEITLTESVSGEKKIILVFDNEYNLVRLAKIKRGKLSFELVSQK